MFEFMQELCYNDMTAMYFYFHIHSGGCKK
jgi:hypothetical protein